MKSIPRGAWGIQFVLSFKVEVSTKNLSISRNDSWNKTTKKDECNRRVKWVRYSTLR